MDNTDQVKQSPHTSPQSAIMQIAFGPMAALAMGVAARLKIADILKDSKLPAAEIAVQAGAHGPSVYRIMRTLAMMGIFAETSPGSFVNTELSSALRTDLPG